VHKAACDLAATRLDAMTGSIGADIAMVVEEVRHLRADLESANARAEDATTQLQSAKEDLLRTHTELAAVQAEADRVSHALTGVKLDLEREGRTCKTLEADVKDLRVQLLAAQEAQRVPEEVSRFLATTAEVQLQQPEITGLAVPVAFTLHVPVQRDGEREYEQYEHYGGVLQEEATKETSMLALEMLLKEVFFRDASENLARALGIAGCVFDTARWPDAVIAQADV
jgi:predicted  nucleic acid-binding Zn-ribbon protein